MRWSMSSRGVACLVVIPLVVAGCRKSPSPTVSPYTGPTTPTPTVTVPPTPTPLPVRIAVTGNTTLTSIGQTSQLTATATLTDNSTKDVTSDARWTATDNRIVTVSSGLLTVLSFGTTYITANLSNRSSSVAVTATPAGTFVIGGRVREPGAGGIPNARVVDTLSGRSGVTDNDGLFSIAELPRLQAHLKTEVTGYEPAEVDTTLPNADLPIQHVVRLTAGDTVKPPVLAPNDLSYRSGNDRCDDCHMIRVVVPQAGTLHVRFFWTSAVPPLTLYAEGTVANSGTTREVSADLPVNAPREVLLYFGIAPPGSMTTHLAFTIETSMR
jgi:hypothetical protein